MYTCITITFLCKTRRLRQGGYRGVKGELSGYRERMLMETVQCDENGNNRTLHTPEVRPSKVSPSLHSECIRFFYSEYQLSLQTLVVFVRR